MIKQKYKNFSGFSLIELMVVITIIGILASIANPIYLSYTIKSRISNALPVLEGIKNRAMEKYYDNNSFPSSLNTVIGSSTYSDSLIGSISISPASAALRTTYPGAIGIITARFASTGIPLELQGRELSLIAIENTTSITWICISLSGTTNIQGIYLPTTCR